MKIKQLTSYPNPNELGLGNTNETYIRVENSLDVSDIFPANVEVKITDSKTGKQYIIKAKVERTEFRINKMGQLYRDYNVRPGDEIKFTYIERQKERAIFFTVTNYKRAFLSVTSKGTEIVNLDNLSAFSQDLLQREFRIPINEGVLLLKFDKTEKKRADSPNETDFFSCLVNDVPISKGNYYISLYDNNNVLEEVKKNVVEEYILPESLPEVLVSLTSNLPLQQIIYGAPGTGKSFGVDEDIKKYGMHDIRTTFHPDSDYSTFVGAYKPQMEKVVVRDDRGFPVKENGQVVYEKRIVYKYTQQAFLKAYIAAWKDLENPHVLVIEEINRGNCAQVFGDLFQLLDRNDIGFSKYPITADTDIMQVLEEEFDGLQIDNSDAINAFYKDDVVADVVNGSRLLLPNNLYIWATMNTSDQSLFPIDSAFKRRWEWKYVPISNAGKGWKIGVNGKEYDWWSFLEKINKKIWDATNSEDKKLGYFFCKADRKGGDGEGENKIISADRFVGKVLFYVYNDVFKDYGFDDGIFRDREDGNSDLLFQSFFKPNGKPNEEKIEVFLKNLEVMQATEVTEVNNDDSESEELDDTTESTDGIVAPSTTLKVVLDGESIEGADKFDTYIDVLKKIGLEKVAEIAAASVKEHNRFDRPLVSKQAFREIENSEKFSYVEVDGFHVIKGITKRGMLNFLKLCAERTGRVIEIE